MVDLKHEILINSNPEKVFKAIITKEGLEKWWTSDVQKNNDEKSYVFGFNNHAFLLKMEIIKEVTNNYIEWKCIKGLEEWVNTRLIFEISKNEDDSTVLKLTHADWKRTSGWFAKCNTDWGHLMYYLKDYVEGRNSLAFMK